MNCLFHHCIVASLFFFIASCHISYQSIPSQVHFIAIDTAFVEDEKITTLIRPYKDSLDMSMNQVIAYASATLTKGKPESTLGNFFCDALQTISIDYFDTMPDFCIMNYGGIRLPSLEEGPITIRKIFELMPFDNFLVAIEIDGSTVLKLLNHVAADGGWPVSQVRFTIENNQAKDVMINHKPLQEHQLYKVLLSDYMADGGDKLAMLSGKPYKNSGVFVRDALISYLKWIDSQQMQIIPIRDQRIEKK